jgi:integrase
MHSDLESYLLGVAGQDRPDAFVFQDLSGKRQNGSCGLSAEFKAIMSRAGIDELKGERTGGAKGRPQAALSFHSLRHSFNSALSNAGVSQSLRMAMTGHTAASINDRYTHSEMESLRAAVSLMPSLKGDS